MGNTPLSLIAKQICRAVPGAVALAATFSQYAHAEVRYSDVAGYSIDVEWTDSPVYRRPDGRTGSKDQTIHEVLYLGAKNHIFERKTVDQGRGGVFDKRTRKGGRGETANSEAVKELGAVSNGAQWTFEAGSLVKMQQFHEGAQRLVIDLVGSGDAFTCSLTIKDLRQNGVGKIVLEDGATAEVVSRTVYVKGCKVQKGNLISGEN